MKTYTPPTAESIELHDCGAMDHFHLLLIDGDGRCIGNAEINCAAVAGLCTNLNRMREQVLFGADIIHEAGTA